MKIVMIGASGFVGTRLIDLLKDDKQYQLKNVDLEPSHFFNDITVIGDVRNQEDMDRELKGADVVVLLAAKHADNVTPISLYYDTNVEGMRVTLRAMEKNGVKRIVFFSSVAVFGQQDGIPDEDAPKKPFNHYGKSKWQAEQVLQEWYKTHQDWNIDIIRPTVIFGERNRGNVYNLLNQIQSGRFMIVGKGDNKKAIAYVGNIVAFVKNMIDNVTCGYNVFIYTDKPDMSMNELVAHVSKVLNKHVPAVHVPYWLGYLGGSCFDLLSKITGKKYTISAIRVRKFCMNSIFNTQKAVNQCFTPPLFN